MKLSIIMPIYNEERTLREIVARVEKVDISPINKEIIIVNDASTDNSQKIINELKKKYENIISFNHEKNKGKGAAIRTGLENISGDIVVIQDGDMEYNPEDFKKLLAPIINGKQKLFMDQDYWGTSLVSAYLHTIMGIRFCL